jgi:hypothetical protein
MQLGSGWIEVPRAARESRKSGWISGPRNIARVRDVAHPERNRKTKVILAGPFY